MSTLQIKIPEPVINAKVVFRDPVTKKVLSKQDIEFRLKEQE